MFMKHDPIVTGSGHGGRTMKRTPLGKCVLLVDNDEFLVDVLRRRIEASGYGCMTATTGAMALAIFDQRRPDMVVTDIVMPMGDGMDLVERIRSRSDTPILVMTGYRLEHRNRLRLHRDVAVFEKPFDGNELIDRIDSALVLRETRRDVAA
jgi:DNA-binding response OmpR family regulator